MTLQSYLTRLIWWCVLPLVVLATVLALGHVNDIQQGDQAEARRLARSLATAVDQSLRGRIAGLQTLAMSPLADDPARWGELHREAQGYYAGFGSHVALIDAEMRPRLHTIVSYGERLPPLPQPTVQRAVRAALESSSPAISDPYVGILSKEASVAIVVPGLRREQAAFAMLSHLPGQLLANLLDSLELPSGWRITLRDRNGEVIVQRGNAVPAEFEGAWQVDDRTSAAPWTVQVQIPDAVRVQRLRPLALSLGLLVLGFTLVGVWGGQLASRRLARSVRSLVDPSADQGAPGIAEIGQVRHLLEQARSDLQVREAQLRGVVDSATEAIITTDESQTIVLANPAAARTFGYGVAQLIGLPLDLLIAQTLRAQHRHDVEAFGRSAVQSRPMHGRPAVKGLRADGSEFLMEAAISHVHTAGQHLYTVILRDVTERHRAAAELKRMHDELSASHAELQRLMAAQQHVEENERKRIARELHDELQQVLAAIKMDVAAIQGHMAIDPKRVAPLVVRIDELATSAITSSRRIVNDLRPLLLEELGLVAALQALATQFAQRTGIAASVETGGQEIADDAVPGPIAICLYRVAQESLNNVTKHAAAKRVQMSLIGLDGGGFVLRVADDGRGIGADERLKPQSFGLRGMSERVRALGGRLRVEARAEGGTLVEVEIGSQRVNE